MISPSLANRLNKIHRFPFTAPPFWLGQSTIGMSFFSPLPFPNRIELSHPLNQQEFLTLHPTPPPSIHFHRIVSVYIWSIVPFLPSSFERHARYRTHLRGIVPERVSHFLFRPSLSPFKKKKKNGDVKVFSSENESFQSTLRVTTCTSSSPLPLAICVPFVPSFLMCSGTCNTSLNSGEKKSTKLSFFFPGGISFNMNDLSCKGEKIAPRIDQTRPPPSHSIKGVTGLYFPTCER